MLAACNSTSLLHGNCNWTKEREFWVFYSSVHNVKEWQTGNMHGDSLNIYVLDDGGIERREEVWESTYTEWGSGDAERRDRLHVGFMECMVCSFYHMASLFCNLIQIGAWKFLSGGPRILPKFIRPFSSWECEVETRCRRLQIRRRAFCTSVLSLWPAACLTCPVMW